jgi:death-on-curing protein
LPACATLARLNLPSLNRAAMETFLILNGFEVEASVDDEERVILDVAAGRVDCATLAEWLSDHVRPAE